jgi:proton-coupled amino acid transporter
VRMLVAALPVLVANVCLWGSLVLVFYLVGDTLWSTHSSSDAPQVEMVRMTEGTLLFAAQAVVAFEGIGLVLPIRNAMAEPGQFTPVLLWCSAAGTLTLLLVGASAYCAYGAQTGIFVTLNLTGPLALLVRAAFSLATLLTYPLQLLPALQALEDKLGLSGGLPLGASAREAKVRAVQQCLARSCLVVAAFAFSLYAPYDNLIGLAGGLCAVPLAFIFPAWFHLRICKDQGAAGQILDVSLVVFGLIMSPVALAAAVVSWR